MQRYFVQRQKVSIVFCAAAPGVGRGKISVERFREIVERKEQQEVDFSVPGYGLCLERVEYAEGYFG